MMLPENCVRKFIITAVAFPLFSLMIVFMLNFIVDPYDKNGIFKLKLNKTAISLPYNNRLAKIIAFTKKPVGNLILGDSRMNALDVKEISRLTGESYYNFAYNGGTAYEIVDTFWFAARKTKLKNVYIGINFNLYNSWNRRNLVQEALNLNRGGQYYLSFFVTKVSLYNLIYKFLNIKVINEKPRLDFDSFWKVQLNNLAFFYSRYTYPTQLNLELNKIKHYCDRHQINLVFIIPPTHLDLQQKVGEYSLTEEYERYKRDLASIAPVIDFDYPNSWTRDKTMFTDPFHGGDLIQKGMIKEIWSNQLNIGRKL